MNYGFQWIALLDIEIALIRFIFNKRKLILNIVVIFCIKVLRRNQINIPIAGLIYWNFAVLSCNNHITSSP